MDNPLTNKTARFKEELRELLNRTGIDNRVGIPDWILADLIIDWLVALRGMKQSEDRYYDRTSKENALVSGPKFSPDIYYLVFAENRADAINWSIQNDVSRWIYVTSFKSIRPILKENNRYEPIELGHRWQMDLQKKDAFDELKRLTVTPQSSLGEE